MAESKPWHEYEAFWRAWRDWGFNEELLDEAGPEVEQIAVLAGVEAGARVLDAACGFGRHSVAFAQRGFQVTGVDRVASYLDEARERVQAEGLDAEFILSDLRTFQSPDPFDLAVNCMTAFGYFEDQADNVRVMQTLCDALKPGGALVMDLMGKEVLARVFQVRDWTERNGVFLLQERKVERGWSWMNDRWLYITPDGQHEFPVCLWLYSAQELTDMARGVGFSEATAYGDFEGNPYDHEAKRLVMVARK